MSKERAFIPDQFGEILDHGHGKTLRGVWKGRLDEFQGRPANGEVWSLTQFYSVDFSKSRIGVIKCVFYRRTIKVCVSCC